jgi:NADP-dependent 3-hydroxy acid dehydrogenase YdfG
MWSTLLPAHVNVNRLQVMATTQAFGNFDIFRG